MPQEYYFGDDLLVALITTAGVGPSRLAWQVVWFPAESGGWYDYFSGERHESGSEAIVADDINQFPLFVRGGVPVPMQSYSPRPTSATLQIIWWFDAIRVKMNQSLGTSTLYEDDGRTQALCGPERRRRTELRRIGALESRISTVNDLSAAKGRYKGQLAAIAVTPLELRVCVEKPTEA